MAALGFCSRAPTWLGDSGGKGGYAGTGTTGKAG
jgi:hypothetical protein